jgi:hypothetical protein
MYFSRMVSGCRLASVSFVFSKSGIMPNMRFGGSSCGAFVCCGFDGSMPAGCPPDFSEAPVVGASGDAELDGDGSLESVDEAGGSSAGRIEPFCAGPFCVGPFCAELSCVEPVCVEPVCAARDAVSRQTSKAIHSVRWERRFIGKRSFMLPAVDPSLRGDDETLHCKLLISVTKVYRKPG